MSIESPIKGADSSDNNELDVTLLSAEGYRFLIQRRTGGIDIENGKRIPWVDRRFKVTNDAVKGTGMITGDYGFPIHFDYLDLDVQVDRFLHSGPTDFEGRLLAIDYEVYEPEPKATPTPQMVKAYMAEIRKHTGPHPMLLYAGKSFWESPPHSGFASDYGPYTRLWAPWYWFPPPPVGDPVPKPWLHYHRMLDDERTGWWWEFAGQQPDIVQYCVGIAAGIPLDINACRLTEEGLLALTVTPDEPVPEPKPPYKATWPPHPNATRNWSPTTQAVVDEIESVWGVTCSTYNRHGVMPDGSNGEPWGIDVWIAPDDLKADKTQEGYGDLVQKWVEANMERLHVRYLIWWNHMRYSDGGWFSYEPHAKEYAMKSGNPNMNDNRHYNHLHLQLRKL